MEDLTNNERAAMIERAKTFVRNEDASDWYERSEWMADFCLAETESLRQQLSEAEKLTAIKICNVLNDLYVKADSMAEFGEEVRSWYYQESERLNRRDSKEKHDNGD